MEIRHFNWGYELIWAKSKYYCGKMYVIQDSKSTELAYHKKQDITIFVLNGMIKLEIEGQEKQLNKGDSYHINPKIKFKISAINGDAMLLEAGTGAEDDFVFL